MQKTITILIVTALVIALIFHFLKRDQSTQQLTPNSEFKETAVHQAIKNGNLNLVKQLITDGADIEAMDHFGQTALICAVQNDHMAIAKWLLDQGAKMSYTYQREETPQLRKDASKEYQAFSQITETGLDEAFKDLPEDLKQELLSPELKEEIKQSMVDLHFERQNEHVIDHCHSLAMLKLLVLDYGVDINHVDPSGYWPLSSFAEANNIEAVRWLLENNANPNTTSTGETAVYKAIRNNNLEMVKLFIKHGASLDIRDVDGWAPLHSCESVDMAKLLIQHGADPTARDQAGFPTWEFVDDIPTKNFLKEAANKN